MDWFVNAGQETCSLLSSNQEFGRVVSDKLSTGGNAPKNWFLGHVQDEQLHARTFLTGSLRLQERLEKLDCFLAGQDRFLTTTELWQD